jgi:4-amino-4-deoxy-L-arabinose transferase-like glycosyltransferase
MKVKTVFSKFSLLLFLIVCVEAFVILVLLNQASPKLIGGDAWFYDQATVNLLQTGSFSIFNEKNILEPTMAKPPGYSIFLAIVYFFSGNSIVAVRLSHFLLFWLTALGIYRLAKHFVDEKTSKISALFTVTYLPLLFFTIYHLSEVLATFLLVWAVCKAIDWQKYEKIVDVFITAALFAFLTLVRPNWALFAAPIFFLIYLTKGKKSLPSLAVFTIVCALFISPWLIRNYLLTGQIILSSVAKQTAYLSVLQYKGKISYAFTFEEYSNFVADFKKRWSDIHQQAELTPKNETMIDKELLLEESYQTDLNTERQTLTWTQIIFSIPKRIAYLWSTSDSSPPEIYNTFYHRFAQLHFLFITLLILLGICLRLKNFKTEWFIIAPAVYITLIHLIFLMESRYSIPARPFLLIFAATAIVWLAGRLKSFRGETEKSHSLAN